MIKSLHTRDESAKQNVIATPPRLPQLCLLQDRQNAEKPCTETDTDIKCRGD